MCKTVHIHVNDLLQKAETKKAKKPEGGASAGSAEDDMLEVIQLILHIM